MASCRGVMPWTVVAFGRTLRGQEIYDCPCCGRGQAPLPCKMKEDEEGEVEKDTLMRRKGCAELP